MNETLYRLVFEVADYDLKLIIQKCEIVDQIWRSKRKKSLDFNGI